jgi:hypothetical protein
MEAWQYCQAVHNISDEDTIILVWINAGLVTGMQSFSVPRRGLSCRDPSFQTVDWKQAPNSIVEIRHR